MCLVGRLFVIALAPGVSSLVVTTARVRSLAIITAGVVVNVGAVIVHTELPISQSIKSDQKRKSQLGVFGKSCSGSTHSHSPTPGPPVTLHIHSDS